MRLCSVGLGITLESRMMLIAFYPFCAYPIKILNLSLGISNFDMSCLGIFGYIEIYDTEPLNSSSGR